MAQGPGRQRVVLLFAVLAGLFLMHGLSAPSMHCMPMAMPMPAHTMASQSMASQSTASHTESAMPAAMAPQAEMPATVAGDQPAADHMQAGETCVPLRPEGLSGLFLALFLVVLALWRPRRPDAPRLIHPHWPHGPPRTGVDILRTLSISRT